jgi:hypothetical protein
MSGFKNGALILDKGVSVTPDDNNSVVVSADVNGNIKVTSNQFPNGSYGVSSTEVANVSGNLQSQINSINVIGGSGIQVIESPSNIFSVSISGSYATTSYVISASANSYNQTISYVQRYTPLSTTAAISANLQSQILNITGGSQSVSGGVTLLSELNDVNIISPQNNQILVYDTNTWTNTNYIPADIYKTEVTEISAYLQYQIDNISGGNSSSISVLNDLSDVIIVNPQINQTLKYNGSSWVNTNDSSGGSEISAIITFPITGDTLTYNGSDWVNIPDIRTVGAAFVSGSTISNGNSSITRIPYKLNINTYYIYGNGQQISSDIKFYKSTTIPTSADLFTTFNISNSISSSGSMLFQLNKNDFVKFETANCSASNFMKIELEGVRI